MSIAFFITGKFPMGRAPLEAAHHRPSITRKPHQSGAHEVEADRFVVVVTKEGGAVTSPRPLEVFAQRSVRLLDHPAASRSCQEHVEHTH